MGYHSIRNLLLLIGIFGGMWYAFVVWNPNLLTEEDYEISVENEQRLGDLLLEIVTDDYTIIEGDTTLDSTMHVITSRLLTNIGLSDYDHKFYIADDPTINAFALPGGHIVVFTGLIKFTESPEELAGVIAHELGHVELKHVTKKLLAEIGLTIVTSILTNNDPILVDEAFKMLVSGGFSRKYESEADEYSFGLMEQSSLPPTSIASLFRRMNRENLSYDESFELLMSHPHNNARIKSSLEYKTAEGFERKPIDLDWEKFKESL